jgi:hypothetical protein
MSAVVFIQCGVGSAVTYVERAVPSANYAEVTEAGYLRLKTGGGGYTEGEHAGLFKQWDHVVIDQRWLRGPGGRFVSKENR